jgi:hypothetical protein
MGAGKNTNGGSGGVKGRYEPEVVSETDYSFRIP